jgi:DNA-binding IclR family transcriptional regulator
VLDDLAASTGESAALGLPAGPAHLRVALVASSSQRLRFDHVAGDTVRLHASAMGKAFLAFAPGDPRALIEALGPLESYTTHTIVTPEGLTAELAAIRRRGFARNDAERYDGVVGVAAPVLDGAGQARAAVGLQGPASRLGRRRLDALAGEVRAAADRCAGVLPLPLL